MDKVLDILAFLREAERIPIIDVRTPAEYTQGHIPAAINIPLFSNEERAIVGRTYKKSGKNEAIIAGLEFAGPKMKDLAQRATSIAKDKRLLVHCWRGGMRSSSVAWLFQTAGIESYTLAGGYKSFRRHVLESFENEYPFLVIGGLTGSGKTEILHALRESGEQVLDLEKLANHKGSAFGGLGEKSQNTNEQFENDIFWELKDMDFSRPVWIEDESRTIGKNTLPAGIHRSIRNSSLIFLDVPVNERVERLVKEYSKYPEEELCLAVEKIRPRLGDQAARDAIRGINEGYYSKTARLVLHYYDKTYKYGLEHRDKELVYQYKDKSSSDIKLWATHIKGFAEQNRLC
jgi:tRNA 2-selenouridine synthase